MKTGLCLGLRHSNHSKRYSDASTFYVNGWCVCQSVLEKVKEGFTCHMRTAALIYVYQQLLKQLRFIMMHLNILEFLKAFVCTIVLQQSLKYIMCSLLCHPCLRKMTKREKKGRKMRKRSGELSCVHSSNLWWTDLFNFSWYTVVTKFWWLFQLHTMHLVTVVFPVVCICHLNMSVQTCSAFLL